MKALLDAIAARFTAQSLATTITGGFHYGKASQGTAMPFLVVTSVWAQNFDAFGGGQHFEGEIQFAVFGHGGTGALPTLASAETVMAAYDNVILSLTGATQIGMYRQTEPIVMLVPEDDPAKDQNVRNVWGVYWSYVYAVD